MIAGAAATLDHPSLRAVLVELLGAGDRYGFDESRLRQRMAHSGFEECSYSPLSRRLSPRTREAGNNVLFVRDRRFVEERLAEAPPFTVLGKTV